LIAVRREPNATFNDKELTLLKTFADQAVIAIQNARLFNETQRALQRQTATADVLKVIAATRDDLQPVFDAIARSANQLLRGHSTMVARLEEGKLHLVGSTSTGAEGDEALRARFPAVPLPGSPTLQVLQSGEPMLIDDTETHPALHESTRDIARKRGFRGMLVCPLLREGTTTGVITVTRKEPGPFEAHQVELLQTFADQAVIAIENVRLFNDTKEALERQTATAEVLNAISNSVSDTTPVFEKILDSCQHLFATEQLGIVVLKDDGLVHIAAWRGESMGPVMETFPRPLELTMTSRALAERRVIQFEDAAALDPIPESMRAVVDRVGHHSIAYAPMLAGDERIGAIVVMSVPPRPLNAKQVAQLKTFADQAVIAIQNARQFNETREALEQQTATAEVLKVISGSMADATPVFEKILESCEHLFGGDELDVLLVDEQGLLQIAAYKGMSHDVVAATFPAPVEITPAGQAIRARRVMHWPDRAWPGRPQRPAQDVQARRVQVAFVRPDAVGRPRHRCHRRGAVHRPVQGEGAGDAADLRRPGGYRDPERAAVQRDARSAGAADGHRGSPAGHQPVDG
jgi:GAF domain-containing protein